MAGSSTLSSFQKISPFSLIASVIGSLLYRFILTAAIRSNLFPSYAMRLISAVIVGIALSIPAMRHYSEQRQLRKRNVYVED